MKSRMKCLLSFAVLMALFTAESIGQSPGLFHYQAVLRDSDNIALSGKEVTIRISILRDNEDGVADYVETHSVTTGASGQIDLLVGDGFIESGSMDAIAWGATTHFMKVEVDPDNGTNYSVEGTSQLVSVPYAMYAGNLDKPLEKLEVKEPAGGIGEEALFEVKREDGSVVFAVYNEGVRIYVDEEQAKGAKGGFAIGGYNASKGYTDKPYMRVTPDSVRIYVRDQLDKGIKGGFAIGGYNSSKDMSYDLLQMSIDSVSMFTNNKMRIYINDMDLPGKGANAKGANAKGGFAVGGYNPSKNGIDSYLQLDQDNYFVGHQAGANNDTGVFNSFFGYQAGFSNTGGNNNIFMGYNTGYFNTIGTDNVFIGKHAGYNNTTGNLNAFIGHESGFYNTVGKYNTFLGFWSGRLNSTGELNTYLGAQAGEMAETGNLNTVIGAYAGSEKNFGDHNTFIGMRAGSTNQGSSNTLIGSQAGYRNVEGIENIMIGFYAGEDTEGSTNIFIGNNAGNHSNGGNNIFIGQHAGVGMERSNRLIIDNFSTADSTHALIYGEFDNRAVVLNGNVGVWTYPEAAFHVGGDLKIDGHLVYDKGLTFGSAFGPSPEFEATGNHLSFGHPGVSEDFIGYANNTFYFLDSPGGGDITDPDVVFGNNVFVDSGSVAIGSIFPTQKLDVDGGARFRDVTVVAGGYGDIGLTPDGTLVRPASDERLKTDFRELENALDKVLSMQGYSFTWKEDQIGKRDVGFKASEVEKVFPEAVFGDPVKEYQGINYSRMPVLIIEAVKEQQRQLDEKDRRIEELEERLSRIEAMLQK